MSSFEIRNEMNAQLRRIDAMDASECISYMSGLYEHDLDEDSPLWELRAEAKSQCERDYRESLSPSDLADWQWLKDLGDAHRRGVL